MASTSTTTLCLAVLLSLLVSQAAACGSCSQPSPPPPAPADCPPPPPSSYGKCPKNTLKLGVCANVLGLVKIAVGKVPTDSCCALLDGLADLEAAVCLCTALKANVLGITLNVPIKLSLLLNYCGKTVPNGFICA